MALKVCICIYPLSEQLTNDCQTLNAKNAGALDKDLMSIGAFSLDQLMELAGLSVSQAGPYQIEFETMILMYALSLPCSPTEQGKENPGGMWTRQQR